MIPTNKIYKVAILASLLLLVNFYSYSQEQRLQVKIKYDGTNITVDNPAIPNNVDLELNFEVPSPTTDYSFGYNLENNAEVSLTNGRTESNNVFFTLDRKGFNKVSTDDITFIITKTTDNSKKKIPTKIALVSLAKGNILDDAMTLKNEIDKNAIDEQLIIDIISYYRDKQLTASTLQFEIDSNPYLKDIIKTSNNAISNELFSVSTVNASIIGNKASSNVSLAGAQAGSLSGVDVTKYANAVADVMIDHAKQELTIAFFNRFKTFIDKHEEFKILFPKTTDKLANLLSYKYPEMIKALRVVFQEDIKMIAYRVDDVLELPKYIKLSAKYPEITVAIRSLRLIHQLQTGVLNASGVLDAIANFKEWDDSSVTSNRFKNVGNALKTANLLNQSISYKDDKGKMQWHDSKTIGQLYQDDILFKLYMGLLFEKAKSFDYTTPVTSIKFIKTDGTPIAFTKILEDQSADVFFFQNKIHELTDLTLMLKTTYDANEDRKSVV